MEHGEGQKGKKSGYEQDRHLNWTKLFYDVCALWDHCIPESNGIWEEHGSTALKEHHGDRPVSRGPRSACVHTPSLVCLFHLIASRALFLPDIRIALYKLSFAFLTFTTAGLPGWDSAT